jgi:hydroxymethylpyrimidine pyrophosphatase-like HAD family hydrolase
MVTENGALSLVVKNGRTVILDRLTLDQRIARRAALTKLVSEVQARFPLLQPSDDAFSRQADFTLDIGEAVTVPNDIVEQASRFARAQGARVTRSSIHLHLSLDVDDKASGSLRFLSQVLGLDPTLCRSTFAFVGDSENDAACFNAYDTTIAVANFRGAPARNPRYITQHAMGAGFVELAQKLLQHRAPLPGCMQ